MNNDEKQMVRELIRDYSGTLGHWYFFHQLWTEAVGRPGYVKNDWLELEAELFPQGKELVKPQPA